MKRDMDLIRKILFYIEDNYKAGQGAIEIKIEGYTKGEIYEHCVLAYQGGLIQRLQDVSTSSGYECFVYNLTNDGFDYLEMIRQDTIWRKTKRTLEEKTLAITIGTIKTIASAFVTAAAEGVANAILKSGG